MAMSDISGKQSSNIAVIIIAVIIAVVLTAGIITAALLVESNDDSGYNADSTGGTTDSEDGSTDGSTNIFDNGGVDENGNIVFPALPVE